MVYYIWHPPPAHPSLSRAATCNVRTLLPGPEGVRSWQVLLYELYSSGMCLVSLPDGTFTRQKLEQVTTLSGCGLGLITVGGIAKPRRPPSWLLMSLVLYLMMMTQLVPSQILCNGWMSLIWQGMPPDIYITEFTKAMLVNPCYMSDHRLAHKRARIVCM